ncbi:MAG: hypothetical protein ACU85V_00335 [Gammaproteobacteria bacterium]
MLRLALFILLAVSTATSLADASQQFVDDVFAYLNFDPGHQRALFDDGEIVHSAMAGAETLPEELAVSGALLLVRRPVLEVVETYLAEETFRDHHGIHDYGYIDGEDLTVDFARVGFSDDEARELKKLRRARAGSAYNMNAQEIERLSRAGRGEINAAYRELLGERAESYLNDGVSGMRHYLRGGGRSVSPAREQEVALASIARLLDAFPEFVAAVQAYPATTGTRLEHQHMWIKTRQDDRPLFVLSHHMVDKLGTVALGLERHFYVGHGYNSLLTLVGVIPWQDDALVFAVNHTFTDQVTGFAAGMKRNRGREILTARMVETFRELRQRLESR